MFTYRITSKNSSQSASLSETSKLRTFNRSKKRALRRFKVGRKIKLNNTGLVGTVLEVILDMENINWVGNTPHFIRVRMDGDGQEYLTSPTMIRSHS